MSVPRKKQVLRWMDSDGKSYTDTSWSLARGRSLASIPAQAHLMDGYCPARHLLAVLVSNGDGDPIVMVHRPSGNPTGAFLLFADTLAAAMFWTDDEGVPRIAPLGEPKSTVSLSCPSCPPLNDYTLDAKQLNEALSKGKRRIGIRRGETR